MIYPDIVLSPEQEAEISAAVARLPAATAWAVLKHTGDLLRGKREIGATDVRHAIAAALHRARGRAA